MEKALKSMRSAVEPSHPELMTVIRSLATIYRQFDRVGDVVELLRKELELLTEEGQALSSGVSQALCSISGYA